VPTGWAKLIPRALATANSVLCPQDQRLISVLQCSTTPRLTAEKAAAVLNLSPGTVRRCWRAMTMDGALRVVVSPIARPVRVA
jgi:hypothetical protein